MTKVGQVMSGGDFGALGIVTFIGACYAPAPQLNAVLLGLLAGMCMTAALLWKNQQEEGK